MTLKPDPPPQVEVLRIGSGEATASRLFQLFATQALPAGSITTSVRIWILPLRNTWMTSPGLVPAGWPFVSSPANSTTQRPNVVATQTSSLPSIDTPQGTSTTPPPVKPSGAGWVPSGRIMFTMPVVILGLAKRVCIMCAVRILNCSIMDTPAGIFGCGKSGDMLLVTQRLPLESKATPRTLIPQRNDATVLHSTAGEIQQLIARAIGNPDVTVRSDTDTH